MSDGENRLEPPPGMKSSCDYATCPAEDQIDTNTDVLCDESRRLQTIFAAEHPNYHDLAHMYLALRAALLGMVRAFGYVPQGRGDERITANAGNSREEYEALAAALRALGLPDPCPLADVPEV